MYEYKAILVSVVDGDTLKVDIDLGFDFWSRNQNIRLSGLNTPETKGSEREKGLIAKKFLDGLLPMYCGLTIRTEKTGKYGRYIATVYRDGSNINQILLDNGYAKPYESGAMDRFPEGEEYPLKKEE